MKKTLAVMSLLAATPACADPIGIICNMTIAHKNIEWHISMDFDTAKYTARAGDQIVKSQQDFEVVRSFGANFKPAVQALKFVVRLSPMDYFLVLNAKNYSVALTPLSGSNPNLVGNCRDDKFRGL